MIRICTGQVTIDALWQSRTAVTEPLSAAAAKARSKNALQYSVLWNVNAYTNLGLFLVAQRSRKAERQRSLE